MDIQEDLKEPVFQLPIDQEHGLQIIMIGKENNKIMNILLPSFDFKMI